MNPTPQDALRDDSRRITDTLALEPATARIEVQMLLQHILGVSRARLLAHPDQQLDDTQAVAYHDLLQRRLAGEPLAYILGEREFYGLTFKVTPATLIPRPETELLVQQALERLPRQGRVLDLGTGSGAIALAIAHARPDVDVTAVDASPQALEVARENALHLLRQNTESGQSVRAELVEARAAVRTSTGSVRTGIAFSNVRLLRSDWFSELGSERFDLIVSNPPYVAEGDAHLAQGDLRFEPRSALASGADGLDDIRRIVALAKEHLSPGGHLLFEHGYDQDERVRELLRQAGYAEVFSAHDLSGIARISCGTWPLTVIDTLHRPLRDLRISVTDRCNLRCTYCMPSTVFDKHHAFLPRSEVLSFEEIERAARAFVRLGVTKLRLTGGEPLLRRGIEQLVTSLAALRTPQGEPAELAMTTNGVLLAAKAQALKAAGLARVTVSLDSLDDATFMRISDSKVTVQTVLEGIAAAQRAGFTPVKVNMVVQRGVNDHEILAMAEHFRHSGIVLRFIEYMDVGSSNGWRMDDVVSARAILQRIAERYPLEPIDPDRPGEVAERWRYADGAGEIGVIASITQAFCHACSRARLSTDGKLYTCLFASQGLDLRGPLRNGAEDNALERLITGCWQRRNDRYSQLRQDATTSGTGKIEMSYIGG